MCQRQNCKNLLADTQNPQSIIYQLYINMAVDYAFLFTQISSAIADMGFIVHPRCDVVDPNTGEFDGLNIWVEEDQPIEQAFYVLLHLFGHSVQWNVDAELRELGLDVSLVKTEEELTRIYQYEKHASALALTLLHQNGIDYLDQWISNWFYADWMWLKHLYQTGDKVDYLTYWRDDADLLQPEPLPEFTPQYFIARNSF